MKHRIFCCTRPRTGSRDSHTCVASYTYHFWNVCGNLKIALGVNLFVSNGEPRLNHVPSLLERGLNMHFSPKIRHILPPCDNCEIKNGGKRMKKFGQPWLTLAWQCNVFGMYINCCYFWLRVTPKNFLSLSLSFFFIVPRWILGRPGQAEKNEKVSSLYRLRQWTIVEKMKRCLPQRRNVAEKPRGMRLKFVLSQLRTCTHGSENTFVFITSLRFYGEQESV